MNFDSELNINTSDEDIQFPTIIHHHRYEPTHYQDLYELANYLKHMVKSDDVLIDFGSGLMRVPIFMHYLLNIKTIGVEINKSLYLQGQENVRNYFLMHNHSLPIVSYNKNVLHYQFSGEENILFFFNPFSPQIFRTVISHFLESASYQRDNYVILYYAKHEYIDILERFKLFKEIKRFYLSNYEVDAHDTMIIYQMNPII